MRYGIIFVVVLCFGIGRALAKLVEEKFDDGTVHLRYQVDAKNRKSGDYQEFYPTGKPHVRGNYQADKKSGAWTTYDEAGKPQEISHYVNDKLDGSYQWNFPSGHAEMKTSYRTGFLSGPVYTFDEKGRQIHALSYPLSLDVVQKAWKTWSPANRDEPKMLQEPVAKPPYKAGVMDEQSQQAALKYTMLYRFLSGLPVANMGIDADNVDPAQHAAVILHRIGHLNHTPDKPDDMDADFYKSAYAGTSSSNIEMGSRSLFGAIDDFMDDSDPSNIDRVGHRQWILTPSLQKTAFGYDDGFSAMYVFDAARHSDMNWLYIAYPGPGFYPVQLLKNHAAWSLSLNTQKCKIPSENDIAIKIDTLDEHYAVTDSSTAKIVAVAPCPDAKAWPCIIYKPMLAHPGVGRFVVQVTGITTMTGEPAPLTYLVDVIDMKHPPTTGPEN